MRIPNPFGRYRYVDCPDGSTKRVLKKPDQHFPLWASDWSANVRAAGAALGEVQGELGARAQSEMRAVFAQFDIANGTLQLSLTAAYELYAADPCNGWELLQAEVHDILVREDRNRRALIEIEQVRAIATGGADAATLVRALHELRRMFEDAPAETEARRAIAAANDAAEAWGETE